MKKLYIPLIILIGIGINLFAQEKSRKETRGDKYYTSYSFDKAIDAYTHTKQLSVEGQRRLAESYHRIGLNTEAEAAYAALIIMPGEILPEDYFQYAMVLKANGNYEEAGKWLYKFNELKPGDLRAKDYVAHHAELSRLLKDEGNYKAVNMNINTDAADFAPAYYKDQVVFTSSRETPKWIVRKYSWNGQPFLDMYVSDVFDNQLESPEKFNKKLNRKMHDGPASFSNDGTFMAFTSNHYKDKSKDRIVELQIWFSKYEDEKWSEAEPFALNHPEYSVGHPCLTADGNTMYFTSDMPGGCGGADIYRTTKAANGEWGKAVNLGDKINTEGDEMFPFFEGNNEVLFFTSDGRFGLGGMDIFMCAINGSETGHAHNAGSPLNTQYDDFAMVVDQQLQKGYFSSNRTNGSGSDDIYSVDLLNVLNIGKKIQGIAKDKDGTPVPNTLITLRDEEGTVLNTLTTEDDGAFTFLTDPDETFKLTGTKDNYSDGKADVNTFGKEFIVKADVLLLKKEEEVIRKEPVITKKPEKTKDLGYLLDLNPIYFDLNKYFIRPDAKIEMDKIVKIMNQYPDMIVELSSYTDCRETEKYNQVLSDKRAKGSAEYIKSRISRPERIYGKGYGETKLVNRCACESDVVSHCPESEHQQNRRTEFMIMNQDASSGGINDQPAGH